MTTIACTTKEIAADRLCFTHSDEEYRARKIHRIGESLFAESGEQCESIIDWLRGGARRETRPEFDKGVDPEVIELAPSGIYRYGRELVREKIEAEFYASGSGRLVALYCMQILKLTPQEAVAEAAKVDHWTDGPVDVERLA